MFVSRNTKIGARNRHMESDLQTPVDIPRKITFEKPMGEVFEYRILVLYDDGVGVADCGTPRIADASAHAIAPLFCGYSSAMAGRSAYASPPAPPQRYLSYSGGHGLG